MIFLIFNGNYIVLRIIFFSICDKNSQFGFYGEKPKLSFIFRWETENKRWSRRQKEGIRMKFADFLKCTYSMFWTLTSNPLIRVWFRRKDFIQLSQITPFRKQWIRKRQYWNVFLPHVLSWVICFSTPKNVNNGKVNNV